MRRSIEKEKARNLRIQGHSYSMIKTELGISKSTLSGWLKDLPLSDKRISELQSNSEIRIEKNRITKQNKKDARRKLVYEKVAYDIENSKDPEFVAGFYLYWGEGTKTAEYTVALTNTDPAIIKCFVTWLRKFGITSENLKIKLLEGAISPSDFLNQLFEIDQSTPSRDRAVENLAILGSSEIEDIFIK